jgi:hypothetical protein
VKRGICKKEECKMRVKLYKIISGKLRLVDYGVSSKMEDYARQGYVAIIE